jgi:hypothetical protein
MEQSPSSEASSLLPQKVKKLQNFMEPESSLPLIMQPRPNTFLGACSMLPSTTQLVTSTPPPPHTHTQIRRSWSLIVHYSYEVYKMKASCVGHVCPLFSIPKTSPCSKNYDNLGWRRKSAQKFYNFFNSINFTNATTYILYLKSV